MSLKSMINWELLVMHCIWQVPSSVFEELCRTTVSVYFGLFVIIKSNLNVCWEYIAA